MSFVQGKNGYRADEWTPVPPCRSRLPRAPVQPGKILVCSPASPVSRPFGPGGASRAGPPGRQRLELLGRGGQAGSGAWPTPKLSRGRHRAWVVAVLGPLSCDGPRARCTPISFLFGGRTVVVVAASYLGTSFLMESSGQAEVAGRGSSHTCVLWPWPESGLDRSPWLLVSRVVFQALACFQGWGAVCPANPFPVVWVTA